MNNITKTKQNKIKGDDDMNYTKALIIKFIASLVLLYIVLGLFYGMPFGYIFVITSILVVTSYFLGDIFILQRTNNTVATIADFGLAFLAIWLMRSNLTYGANLFTAALIGAVGVALFEFFFHKYLVNLKRNTRNQIRNFRYQQKLQKN